MHRNTFVFIGILAVIAALIIGINVGRSFNKSPNIVSISPTPFPSMNPTASPLPLEASASGVISASPSATPKQSTRSASLLSESQKTYANTTCGISFRYPSTLKEDSAEKIHILLDTNNPETMLMIICEGEIPTPTSSKSTIETKMVGTTQIKIYHDTSTSGQTPIDSILFVHPTLKKTVFIGGAPSLVTTILPTLTLLQ